MRVTDQRSRFIGRALWSPRSEIRLRLLTTDDTAIDPAWWAARLEAAHRRRAALDPPTSAYRVAFGEADALPSLIVDRYGEYAVVQLLSAGLETARDDVLDAVEQQLQPRGILLRNDASVRRHEGLPLAVEQARGEVPDSIPVHEGNIRYRAAPVTGQKTGAFLDQRQNRALVGAVAHGRALDLFCHDGLFALHMAAATTDVLGVDQSRAALDRAEGNAVWNGIDNVRWREGNVFDLLREWNDAGERFDTVVLDPPAFARDKASVPGALRGYREINRRALRLLSPGGHLFTASCSYHVGRDRFLAMLRDAAADAGRRVVLEQTCGQPADHPETLTVPETGYLKAVLLRVVGDSG